jgi:gas vesicle protein
MLIRWMLTLLLALGLAACGQGESDRAGAPEPGDSTMEEMHERFSEQTRRAEEVADEITGRAAKAAEDAREAMERTGDELRDRAEQAMDDAEDLTEEAEDWADGAID